MANTRSTITDSFNLILQIYRNIRRNWGFALSVFLVFIGLAVATYFFYGLSRNFHVWGKEEIDVTKTGAVGDFIAGVVGTIFSCVGLIMVFLTYRDQRRSNEKSAVENRFFTLLQIHVNNADNISYTNPYRRGN